MNEEEYKIGDVYWYAAQGNNGKLKLYRIRIYSTHDFNKGIVRSKSKEKIEQFIKDHWISK